MNVIFLDHDGVICMPSEWGSRRKKAKLWIKDVENGYQIPECQRPVDVRFDNFNKDAVKLLNNILEKTNAEIVVSSDWKIYATVKEMGDYYQQQGIIKKPIDFTSTQLNKDYSDFPWNPKFDLEMSRSLEILEWLEQHTEVEKWLAIDDLNMSLRDGWGLSNFIHTRKREGLKQTGLCNKIIKYFI